MFEDDCKEKIEKIILAHLLIKYLQKMLLGDTENVS